MDREPEAVIHLYPGPWALPRAAIPIRVPHTIQEIAFGVLVSASNQAENRQALEGSIIVTELSKSEPCEVLLFYTEHRRPPSAKERERFLGDGKWKENCSNQQVLETMEEAQKRGEQFVFFFEDEEKRKRLQDLDKPEHEKAEVLVE